MNRTLLAVFLIALLMAACGRSDDNLSEADTTNSPAVTVFKAPT